MNRLPFSPAFVFLPLLSGVGAWWVSSHRGAGEMGTAARAAVVEPAGAAVESPEKKRVVGFLDRVAAAGDVVTLQGLWAEVKAEFKGDALAGWMERRVLERMIAVDAKAGWAWVLTFPVETEMTPKAAYLGAWGAVDWRAAGEAVLATADEKSGSLQWIVQGWLAAHPLEFLTTGPPESWGQEGRTGLDSYQARALLALCDTDLPKALALAGKMCKPNHTYASNSLIDKLAAKLVEADGAEGALERAKGMKDWPESLRSAVALATLPGLAKENPAQAAKEYETMSGSQFNQVATAIVGAWAKQDAPAALAWLSGMASQDRLSSADPWAAIGRVTGPDAAKLEGIFSAAGEAGGQKVNVSSGWCEAMMAGMTPADLPRLTRDLAALPASFSQPYLLAGAIGQWAKTDFAAASAAMAELSGSAAAEARKALAGQVMQDGSGTLPVAGKLDLLRAMAADGDGSAANMRFLATILAREAPAGTLEVVLTTPKETQQMALPEVFRSWAGLHPAEAAERMATLPAENQSAATGGLVQGWAEFDPMAASVWAHGLPAGAGRDAAARSLVRGLQTEEPASAFAWAASIGDPGLQRECVTSTFSTWVETDPAAARRALEAATLPDLARSQCLERLAKKP